MTIEERAAKLYGETTIPQFGVWLLRDGTLLNGSYEGFQRDVDHAEISQFFKPSKRQAPGGTYTYLLKFMRRGNIRWSASKYGYCIDMIGMPTANQFHVIQKAMRQAERTGIDTSVAYRKKSDARHPTYMRWQEWLYFAARYAKDTGLRRAIEPYVRIEE